MRQASCSAARSRSARSGLPGPLFLINGPRSTFDNRIEIARRSADEAPVWIIRSIQPVCSPITPTRLRFAVLVACTLYIAGSVPHAAARRDRQDLASAGSQVASRAGHDPSVAGSFMLALAFDFVFVRGAAPGGDCQTLPTVPLTSLLQLSPREEGLDLVARCGGAVFGPDLGPELSCSFAESLIGQELSQRTGQVTGSANPNPRAEGLLASGMPHLVEHARHDRGRKPSLEGQCVRAVRTRLHEARGVLQQWCQRNERPDSVALVDARVSHPLGDSSARGEEHAARPKVVEHRSHLFEDFWASRRAAGTKRHDYRRRPGGKEGLNVIG